MPRLGNEKRTETAGRGGGGIRSDDDRVHACALPLSRVYGPFVRTRRELASARYTATWVARLKSAQRREKRIYLPDSGTTLADNNNGLNQSSLLDQFKDEFKDAI